MEKTYERMTPEQAIREIESGNFYRVDGVKAFVIDALKEVDKDCTGCIHIISGLMCNGCSRVCVDCYEAEDESDECFSS